MTEQEEKDGVLKRFVEEHFDFDGLLEIGLFTKEMKGDYKAQAERVRKWFGYETVFEYGAKEISGHITYVDGCRPENEGFVTVIPSIYD